MNHSTMKVILYSVLTMLCWQKFESSFEILVIKLGYTLNAIQGTSPESRTVRIKAN